jgi:hypothetical protein
VLVEVGDGPPAPHDALVLAVDEDLAGGVVDVLEAVRLAHDVAADDAERRRPIRLLLLLRELFDVAVHGGGAERRLALHVLYAAAVRELDEQAHEGGELAATVAALDGHIVLHVDIHVALRGHRYCLLLARSHALLQLLLVLLLGGHWRSNGRRRTLLAFADAAVSPMGMGSPLYVAACACFRWPSL